MAPPLDCADLQIAQKWHEPSVYKPVYTPRKRIGTKINGTNVVEKYSKIRYTLSYADGACVTRYAAMQGLHFRACLHKLKAIGGGLKGHQEPVQ